MAIVPLLFVVIAVLAPIPLALSGGGGHAVLLHLDLCSMGASVLSGAATVPVVLPFAGILCVGLCLVARIDLVNTQAPPLPPVFAIEYPPEP